MSAENYHSGVDGHAYVTPSGDVTPIELAVHKWEAEISGNNQEVSNAKDGRKRIPGAPDAKGSASLHWDSGNQPSDTTPTTGPSVRHSTILAMCLIPDGSTPTLTNGFRFSAIVDTVKITSEFQGTVDYDVTFSYAGGGIKYPGDA